MLQQERRTYHTSHAQEVTNVDRYGITTATRTSGAVASSTICVELRSLVRVSGLLSWQLQLLLSHSLSAKMKKFGDKFEILFGLVTVAVANYQQISV